MAQTIASALASAVHELSSSSQTAQLDAEVLLGHVLHVSRSYLIAFSERELSAEDDALFAQLIQQRCQGVPVAYLVGHSEFWSLDLVVTPDTLIPRSDTELLVELVLELIQGEGCQIADLGTGSGAIALAVAKEKPTWQVCATDKSAAALQVAQLNSQRLNIENVVFYQGAWCQALPKVSFDAIVSNPPYIAQGDPYLQQSVLQFEPAMALIAADEGLDAIQVILLEARDYLKPGGYLLLEHGFQQAKEVEKRLNTAGYSAVRRYQDLSGWDRVTVAKWNV